MFPQTAQAAFPGANGVIAFNSNRDGNNEIYRLNSDSTNPINLTNNAASDTSPSLSADGTKIAFNSDRDGNSEIYTMNADGTSQTRLTNNSASDANPAWSPDGTKLVFTSARDGNSEIYIMNADGSGQTNITNNPASQTNTNWSPDGAKIVYQTGITIRTINIDGSNDVLITAGNNPNWSPDGTKIAFNHDFGGGQGQEIYYINLDGTGLTQVTTNAATNAVPAWSPDSSKIVFRSVRDGNNEIYSININGTDEARLTNNLFDDNSPDWQPLTISPAAANDSATTAANQSVIVNVLANDTDTYGLPSAASVTIANAPANGSTSINSANGQITYRPNTGFSGSDTFTYRVCSSESSMLCDTAMVSVAVGSTVPGVPNTGFKPSSANYSLLLLPSGLALALFAVKKPSRKR